MAGGFGSVMNKKSHAFAVAASPFNGVKVELGLLLIVMLPIWLLVHRFVSSTPLRLLSLCGFGIGAAIWILFRIQQVQQSLAKSTTATLEK